MREGGPTWVVLVVPAFCWFAWHLLRRFDVRLAVRVVSVTAFAIVVLFFATRLFDVDTDKLRRAVQDAGISVNAVSRDRTERAVVVSIQSVSWGPERNQALRAIFAAANSYAKMQKMVSIQWGDAMITTVAMNDIAAYFAEQITYGEMINRMQWSGTPDILPQD